MKRDIYLFCGLQTKVVVRVFYYLALVVCFGESCRRQDMNDIEVLQSVQYKPCLPEISHASEMVDQVVFFLILMSSDEDSKAFLPSASVVVSSTAPRQIYKSEILGLSVFCRCTRIR